MSQERKTLERYSLPADLVQRLANLLNELPARMSRQLINELEAECLQQELPDQDPTIQADGGKGKAK